MRTLIVLFFIGAVILNTPEVASASEAISTEESTADYLAIQRVFLQEDFSETNRLSEAFLSRYPDAPGATRVALWRILSLDRIGEKQQALAKIRLLMERLPQTDALWSEAVFWDGEISRRSQETARAARAYRRLLEKSANSQWTSQARMGLGLVCIQEQEFEKAQEHFRKVSTDRKATPLGQEAQVLEGLCLLRLRKFQEAASFLEPLMGSLQQANLRAQAFCYLGESFSGLKDFAQALTHYRAALESTDSPWEAVAQFGVGWSAAELNRCQESVEAFDRYFSLRLKERRAEALFIQGRCLLQLGKEREGIWRLKQMSSEFPGHPLALESGLIVSERYRLERRWDLAKQSLHALLRQHPEGRRRAKVLVSLGRLALDQTNVAEARTVLQLAAKTDELAVKQEALSGLAEIQVFLGNFQAAEDLYEEAMWLDEESAAAVAAAYRVARLRLDMNDANGAIAILQRLESTAQGRLKEDAQIGLVAAYLAQRKDMLAKEIIRKIYAEKPSQMMSGRVAYYEALLTLGEGNELLASQFCRDATLWAIHTEEGFEAKLLLIEMEGAKSQSVCSGH
ncbi:MAG: tetratricopeptide repeat protein [Candidatus Omnitrophica bacterium]|nr:tetratricopeptide repeat protein [Candidatus Omnitrophota bacterium]